MDSVDIIKTQMLISILHSTALEFLGLRLKIALLGKRLKKKQNEPLEPSQAERDCCPEAIPELVSALSGELDVVSALLPLGVA